MDIELRERYEEAPDQLADAARLWIEEAVERRVYGHGLNNARTDISLLKLLKKNIDSLSLHIGRRSEIAVERFLKPRTITGQKMWIHSHLAALSFSNAHERLDEAFRNAFRYVVYPLGQYFKEVGLLDCPIDDGDALTSNAEIENVGWIPVCAPEPRLAIQEELSNGLRNLIDLARQRDALNRKASAEEWLKTWKALNSKESGN
ncbi:hypothetical protein [Achromobacter xylosoxidans]|uniref:hypothetical protein n=1 Tax=Alcaligenes xylosoxydans xylosoxydans TaxID=85698 RepID=UPI001177A6D5|nr:hypothetical protein [Achromobacter xylosoxidans]